MQNLSRLYKLPIILSIDFDNVIHVLDDNDWEILNKPMEGAREALIKLKSLGCEIIIHSVRSTDRIIDKQFTESQYKNMESWLNIHGIPYDSIWNHPGKPFAHIYIDDRGFRFSTWEADLDPILNIIQSFKNSIS